MSDLFEWKNLCFQFEDYSTFNLNEMTECPSVCQRFFLHSDAIAVFHIKFISSI